MTINLQKGFTDELKLLAARSVIGAVAGENLETGFLPRLDKHFESPLRMFASATPDALLNFASALIEAGDGSGKAVPPVDDIVPFTPVGFTINFQTGVVSGGVVVTVDGVAFALPTTTVGQVRRCCFALQSDGSLAAKFSSAFADMTTLNADTTANPGALFSALEGLPLGWIDLEATAANAFKTAGSASSVIQNKVGSDIRIYRFGAGGGGGGGSDRTYKVTNAAGTTLAIKGGFYPLDDSRVLASGTAGLTKTLTGVNLSVSAATILTNSGLVFAADTLYTLAIDLATLSDPVRMTDTKRKILQWGEANLRLFPHTTHDPENLDPRRYVYIDQIKTAVGGVDWTGSEVYQKPGRVHDTVASFFPYVERKVFSFTAAGGEQTLGHNLSGQPQWFEAYWYDGTENKPQDWLNFVVAKSLTQVKINPDSVPSPGYGGGRTLYVVAYYYPDLKTVASPATDTGPFGWYTAAGPASVAHGVADYELVRSYEVQEKNLVTGAIRNIDRSAIVESFDDTNFNFDWVGVPFVEAGSGDALAYRICVGGRPLLQAVPYDQGGMTRVVGRGPGTYTTLTDAIAASGINDQILVQRDTDEPAGDLDINVAGLQIVFARDAQVRLSGALTNGVRLTAARVAVLGRSRFQLTPSGTQARGLSVEAVNCVVEQCLLELNAAQTFTDPVYVDAAANRAFVRVNVHKTNGSAAITNIDLVDNDGVAGSVEVWGGTI